MNNSSAPRIARFSGVLGLVVAVSMAAYGNGSGISGRTLKPGSTPGCGCHGTQNTGTTFSFTGSTTVTAGNVYPFVVNLSGTSGSNGGIDIAVFRGGVSLSPSSTFLRVLNGELTQTQARPVPTSFQFNYTAPSTAGTDTMYVTGKGGASSNSWNHATKLVFNVVITSIKERSGLPARFGLGQNFPNPFNPSTQMTFDIPSVSDVLLAVYNVEGKQVALLAERKFSGGSHTVSWNAVGQPSGLYFARLQVHDANANVPFSFVRKLVLIK